MADKKKSELAKIHIAKKQLGLDDDTYRAMLQQVASVNSAGELAAEQRGKVLEHLKNAGFKGSKTHKGRPHNTDKVKQLKKIEALLADSGRPWSYAAAMAKHMYKKEALAFCDATELGGIIAALVKDAKKREEVG